jgi:hypothetical protein
LRPTHNTISTPASNTPKRRQQKGKYHQPGGGPPEARLNRYRGRYAEAEARYAPRAPLVAAVGAYCDIAARHGMAPAELALRCVFGFRLGGEWLFAEYRGVFLCSLQRYNNGTIHPPAPQKQTTK